MQNAVGYLAASVDKRAAPRVPCHPRRIILRGQVIA
jgi:hypothetical protein